MAELIQLKLFNKRDYIKRFFNKRIFFLAVAVKLLVSAVILIIIFFGGYGAKNADAAYGLSTGLRQVKAKDSNVVYYLDHARGKKKAYVNEKSFLAYGNKKNSIKTISRKELDKWPDVNLVKEKSSPAVYYIKNGKKALIKSESDFKSFGFKFADVVTIKKEDLDSYADASCSQIGLSYRAASHNKEDIEIKLDEKSPAGGSLALDTRDNVLAVFSLKSKSDALVDGIVLTLEGVFKPGGIERIKVSDENGAIYDVEDSLSGREAILFFASKPLVLNANAEKKIKILFDMGSYENSENHTIRVKIAGPEDIIGSSFARGTFPISGGTFKLVDARSILGKLRVEEKSIAATAGVLKAVAGSTGQTIMKIKISETTGREDLSLKEIILESRGTVDNSTVAFFKLRDRDNKTISQAGTMTADNKVIFKLNNYKINKNDFSEFTVQADILKGEGRFLNFNIAEVKATGLAYGFNLFDEILNINENTNIIREFLGVTAKDLRPSARVFKEQTGVIMGTFEIRNGNKKIILDSIGMNLDRNPGAPLPQGAVFLVNFDTGEIYGSVNASALAQGEAVLGINKAALDPRKTVKVAVLGDIPKEAKNGDTYRIDLKKVNYFAENGVFFSDSVNVPGVSLSVNKSNLFIFPDASLEDTLYTKGQKGVKIASFVIEAAAGDDVVIKSVGFANGADTSGFITFENGFSNLKVSINGSFAANKIAMPTGGSFIFEGLNARVRAGGRAEIKVFADTERDLRVSETRLKLLNVVAGGSGSGFPTVVSGADINGPRVRFGDVRASLSALSGGGVSIGDEGNLVSSFKAANTGQEAIRLNDILIQTTNNGFSNSLGYSNLKIKSRSNNSTVGSISRPVAGANRVSLGGFRLEPSSEETFDLFVDADDRVPASEFQVFFGQLAASGKTSSLKVNIEGDPTSGVKVTAGAAAEDPVIIAGNGGSAPVSFIWPTASENVNYYFHDQSYPFKNISEHNGIDIGASQGSSVKSAAAGVIEIAVNNSDDNLNYVVIRHSDSLETVYAHLSGVIVQTGQTVSAGQQIGLSGGKPGTVGAGQYTTGPHLHFGVILNGMAVNPMNYLK